MSKLGDSFHDMFVSAAQKARLEIAHKNAEKIIQNLAPVFVHETLELYTAATGILVPNGHVMIGKALEELEGAYCTVQAQNLVLNHVKNKCVVTLAELEPPSDLIPVANGAVSVSTGSLVPYEKGMNFHNQFPIVYDPKARAPNFAKFLNEIQHDPLSRERIMNSFARCFDRTPMKRQADLFIGEHDTGKTTLLKVLRCMLGPKNTASETLQALTNGEDRWSMGNLYNKAVNICAELQSIEIKELGRFKALVGGDPVTAEFKGKPKFEFMPYTKFFFACNVPPKISDKELKEDIAFFERFRITFFHNQFQEEEKDESLVIEDRPEESKLVNQQEISGIFNRCLNILRDMRREQDFRYHFNGEETKAIWFSELNQNKKVETFLSLYTVPKEDGSIQVSDFKQRINVWLLKRRQEMLADNAINEVMQEKFGPQHHGKRRSWKGLEWRDSANKGLDDLMTDPSSTIERGLDGHPSTPSIISRKKIQRVEGGPSSTNSSIRSFFIFSEKSPSGGSDQN